MTTLFKSEKKDVKASFPKINASDDFKNKFFKLARYISKIADVNSVDILECVKTLERKKGDFSAYKVSAFEDMAIQAKYSSKIILESRAKTENLSDVKFLYADGETKKEIYLIVPSCSTANDGRGFYARYQVDYANCKLYSIGYLLLASALEQAARKFISANSYSIFHYSSNSWKYSQYCSIYEAALDTIINVEYNHSLNNNQPEYIAFSHIKELVFSFFNAIFPNVANGNQSSVAALKNQKETTAPKAKVWEETSPTNTGEQLSLF